MNLPEVPKCCLPLRRLSNVASERNGAEMSIQRVPVGGTASFSKAVVVSGAGRTVYVSGNISPDGSMAEQANGCIDQIEAALRAVGGSLEHVVRITAWLTRLDEYGE